MENNTQSLPTVAPESEPTPPRAQPIPPPSEPRQYRAIGLVSGKYVPSEEQSTKGILLTDDGTEVDAVLLGRVISLVKNHLSLEESHLWVVYPRTRQEEETLHAQIVGVWEPEKLQADDPPELPESDTPPATDDGYFSIRGEAVFCSAEQNTVIVKIQQAARKPDEKRKSFKLHLQGELPSDRPVGHFWDLHLLRQGNHLVIQQAEDLGYIPKRRKKFVKGGSGSYSRKPNRNAGGSSRPVRNSDSPTPKPNTGSPRPRPSKPIRRSQKPSQ